MGHWNIIETQLIGKSHVKNNLPCQDYSKQFQDDHITISVLSDGCGSSSHSDVGAQIVVDSTI